MTFNVVFVIKSGVVKTLFNIAIVCTPLNKLKNR